MNVANTLKSMENRLEKVLKIKNWYITRGREVPVNKPPWVHRWENEIP